MPKSIVHGRVRRTAAAVVALGVTAAGPAFANTTSGDEGVTRPRWTQVTDAAGRNIDEVGAARTSDGVLHVFWRARLGALQEEIEHTTISPTGSVGPTVTASGPWASAGNPAAIVTADGGLRVFFGGLTGTSAMRDGVQSAASDAGGSSWATEPNRVSETTSVIGEGVGAALRPDGTPVFAYAHSFVLGLHAGVDPGEPDIDLRTETACCDYFPSLAFSGTDGDGYLAWYSTVEGQVGLWVQQVWPALGSPAPVPGAVDGDEAVVASQRTPIAARNGGAGTYVAYCRGYPRCTEVLVWRIGDSDPVSVAQGTDVEAVNLAADPEGRLWVMWEDAGTGTLQAARSDDRASRFGTVVRFAPPDGASTVWKLQGHATADALDVLAAVTTPGSLATWHARVLPGLTVDAKRSGHRTTFTVTDAGEPVKGATVTVKRTSARTNARGRVTMTAGKAAVTVTKAGYTDVSLPAG